jgi:pyroglutamyl-peptidase
VTAAPRILITGFEPFAGAKLNSSEVVLHWLEGQDLEGVTFSVLPVEYDRSVEHIILLIEDVDPKIVIALGQAEGRATVSFERVAVNLDDARIADNAGEVRRDQLIDANGEAAFMATLPVKAVVEALSASGHPVEESLSAGAFVCNHLFYSVMNHLRDSKSRRWFDFVHLPLVLEQGDEFPGKPTLAKEAQGEVIVDAIKKARELWAYQD